MAKPKGTKNNIKKEEIIEIISPSEVTPEIIPEIIPEIVSDEAPELIARRLARLNRNK